MSGSIQVKRVGQEVALSIEGQDGRSTGILLEPSQVLNLALLLTKAAAEVRAVETSDPLHQAPMMLMREPTVSVGVTKEADPMVAVQSANTPPVHIVLSDATASQVAELLRQITTMPRGARLQSKRH